MDIPPQIAYEEFVINEDDFEIHDVLKGKQMLSEKSN